MHGMLQLLRAMAADLPAHWEAERAEQLQRSLVLAVNRGDCAAVAGRKKNRRVEFMVVPQCFAGA